MNTAFQVGWRTCVAASALLVIYFAFQQGIASLYALAAEKELLAWNHTPASMPAVEEAHIAIQRAIDHNPDHPQYYFLAARIWQWQAFLSTGQEADQALTTAKATYLESAQRRPMWPDTWAELLKIEAQLHRDGQDITELGEYLIKAAQYGPYTPAVNIAISQVGLAKWKLWNSEQKWLVIEHLARGLYGKNSRHTLAEYLKSTDQFKLACVLASRREPKLEINICNSVLK
ncbi:exopolysaccharide biosynthesis protein VpsP [Vibrio mimicus]